MSRACIGHKFSFFLAIYGAVCVYVSSASRATAPQVDAHARPAQVALASNEKAAPLAEEFRSSMEKASSDMRCRQWTVSVVEIPMGSDEKPGAPLSPVASSYVSDKTIWRAGMDLVSVGPDGSPVLREFVAAGVEAVRSSRSKPGHVEISWPNNFATGLLRLDLLDQSLRFFDWSAPVLLSERLGEFGIARTVDPDVRDRIIWILSPKDRPDLTISIIIDHHGSPRVVEFREAYRSGADHMTVVSETVSTVELDFGRVPTKVNVEARRGGNVVGGRVLTVQRSEPIEHTLVESVVRSELVPPDGTRVTDDRRRVDFVVGSSSIEINGESHGLTCPIREYRPDLLPGILGQNKMNQKPRQEAPAGKNGSGAPSRDVPVKPHG